jgi:hypothetical protein
MQQQFFILRPSLSGDYFARALSIASLAMGLLHPTRTIHHVAHNDHHIYAYIVFRFS